MSVQVVYKNKGKSSNSGIIALFANEVFQVKNLLGFMSGNESSFIQKILNLESCYCRLKVFLFSLLTIIIQPNIIYFFFLQNKY